MQTSQHDQSSSGKSGSGKQRQSTKERKKQCKDNWSGKKKLNEILILLIIVNFCNNRLTIPSSLIFVDLILRIKNIYHQLNKVIPWIWFLYLTHWYLLSHCIRCLRVLVQRSCKRDSFSLNWPLRRIQSQCSSVCLGGLETSGPRLYH